MSDTGSSVHIVCPECNAVNRVLAAKLGEGARCGRCKQRLFTGHPVELDETSFDRQIARNDIPVVVDFWAPWCGPCKMMAPSFEQAARDLEPGVRLARLNTEEAPSIAARFNIRSIPTLMVFRDGRETARQSGAMMGQQLMQWVLGHAG